MGRKKDARRAEATLVSAVSPPVAEVIPIGEPPQTAELELHVGRHAALRLQIRLTPAGIGAIAGLVSGILLSTAVVVRAARRDERRDPLLPR